MRKKNEKKKQKQHGENLPDPDRMRSNHTNESSMRSWMNLDSSSLVTSTSLAFLLVHCECAFCCVIQFSSSL